MLINIDPNAGFCFGVSRAIDIAGKYLHENNTLHCLGEIVHNEEEVRRLKALGMNTLSHQSIETAIDQTVLIRAHGEPPETYDRAKENKLHLIDATCPIVLKLQQHVKNAWEEMNEINGQVVIIGNPKHPEVIGLNGHTKNNSIIIESVEDLSKIDFGKAIRLFAQTTIDQSYFIELVETINQKINESSENNKDFKFRKSLCHYVSGRISKLETFCLNNDVIIFISGKNSSNGKTLYNVCKNKNPRSYFISKPEEFKSQWIKNVKSIGISGATSTPEWLMKNLAEKIRMI